MASSVQPDVCLRLLMLEIRTELIEASNYRAWTRRGRTRGHRGRCQPGQGLGSVVLQPPEGRLLHSVAWSSNINGWTTQHYQSLSQFIQKNQTCIRQRQILEFGPTLGVVVAHKILVTSPKCSGFDFPLTMLDQFKIYLPEYFLPLITSLNMDNGCLFHFIFGFNSRSIKQSFVLGVLFGWFDLFLLLFPEAAQI